MKECKMKAVNNQHQLLLKEEVHVYDGKNSKSINTKSDEKIYMYMYIVSCRVKKSILLFEVPCTCIHIEGVSRELACLSLPVPSTASYCA